MSPIMSEWTFEFGAIPFERTRWVVVGSWEKWRASVVLQARIHKFIRAGVTIARTRESMLVFSCRFVFVGLIDGLAA